MNMKSLVLLSLLSTCMGLECDMNEQSRCVFDLKVEPRLTMMYGNNRIKTKAGENGNLYFTNNTLLPKNAYNDVLTADGVNARLVISINDQFPGPDLIMYEGQEVEVNVENQLHTDSITVHFHGIHQRGTPWFDEVAYVTQCPILPGTTFRYHFNATPAGTHWYHAHIGDQRGMGLYGALIVKERGDANNVTDKHILLLQDWNHDMDTETAYQKMLFGIQNCDERSCSPPYKTTESEDGAQFSRYQFHTGLVNGKGRYRSGPSQTQHNGAPIMKYPVETGMIYRFRVISASTLYPFRLYVAGHKLTIIASDGRELKPMEVDSFVIQSGERYDFLLETKQISSSNYMIRAESLEVGYEKTHVAEAILEYSNATNTIVFTEGPCTSQSKCTIFNCPFSFYPKNKNYICKSYNFASSTEKYRKEYETDISKGKDYFKVLNFAFPGPPGNTPGSVNGRQFLSPKVAALVQPDKVGPDCPENCVAGFCICPFTITIKNNDIVEFVFTNVGRGRGWSHPIHLHGHSFYVLQYGFPSYNTETGKYISDNEDIECEDIDCTRPTWRGETKRKRRQANATIGSKDRIPPLKDTVIVPTGGFVRVKFKADNPGLWFLHCHIDLHNTNGMAMMVNESFNVYSKYKEPVNFPKCGDYTEDSDTFGPVAGVSSLVALPTVFVGAWIFKYTCLCG